MEDLETKYINEHLWDLLQKINCNFGFLSQLVSKGALTADEVQRIGSNNLNKDQKNFKLLQLLKTRKNAFKELKDALRETLQTGALKILEMYGPPYKEFFANKQMHIKENQVGFQSIDRGFRILEGHFGSTKVNFKVFTRLESMSFGSNEFTTLRAVDRHENIIRCINAKMLTEPSRMVLALDYKWTLQTNLEETLKIIPKTNLVNQIVQGVSYLHGCKMIHMDLQPCHILILVADSNYAKVKVGGFLFTKTEERGMAEIGIQVLNHCRPAAYYTPEVLNSKSLDNVSDDGVEAYIEVKRRDVIKAD